MSVWSEFITLRDFIRYASSQFKQQNICFGHGTDNAYDEAVALVMQTLSLSTLTLDQQICQFDARLLGTEKDSLMTAIKKRTEIRMPLPYITSEAHLAGYSFYVDKRVIIPRSFIANAILSDQLNAWLHQDGEYKILDLCTGSGSLAIIAADYFENSVVVGSDISVEAREVAAININNYGLGDRVGVIYSDVYSGIGHQQFDLIISNPPYLTDEAMAALPVEYAHEPFMGLSGGVDGLDVIDRILAHAHHYLTDNGILVVEIGDYPEVMEEKYEGLNLIWLDVDNDGYVFVVTQAKLKEYFIL